jgi:hypothetical protein
MSKIEVDAIEPQSGTTLTIGASGDTIIVPAGTVSLPAITTTGDTNTGIFFPAADTIAFTEGGAEAMRIDSSGNVLVGKTAVTITTAGSQLEATGTIAATRSGSTPMYINRLCRERVCDPSFRFNDVYATNATIQTSDQNEKQSIQSLTTAEMNVAKRLSPLIKTFKWNSSVEEKRDSARTHTGIIAQDVQQAFTDEGLDASNYALFISNTWWEKEISVDAVSEEVDENGNVITEAKDAYTYMDTKEEATDGYTERTRLGLRYPELLSFIQAYNDQRFTELEARITTLENA